MSREWTPALQEHVRVYTRHFAPWLEGPGRVPEVAEAVLGLVLRGEDSPLLSGQDRFARNVRVLCGRILGREVPAAKRARAAFLKEAPFAPGADFLADYEEQNPSAEVLEARKRDHEARMAECAARSAAWEADPEAQARRAAVQAKLRRQKDLSALLASVEGEFMTVHYAVRKGVVAIPRKAPMDAGLIRPVARRRGLYSIGHVTYELTLNSNVRVLSRAEFLKLIEPFRDVWTDAMRDLEAP